MSEGQGWTLIARVSNKDKKENWRPGSSWWNDTKEDEGETTNPLDDMDMISPAFRLVDGNTFMITRSDDPHTALLQTTADCLGEQTFRDKIQTTHDGRFEKNRCKRSCKVTYGGNYENTEGFQQASNSDCSQSSQIYLQSHDEIGFWCQYKNLNMAVMMIGAGGDGCSGADHGIGIRHKKAATGRHAQQADIKDFGDKADRQQSITDYSLNLWVC